MLEKYCSLITQLHFITKPQSGGPAAAGQLMSKLDGDALLLWCILHHINREQHRIAQGRVVRADAFRDSAPIWIGEEGSSKAFRLFRSHKSLNFLARFWVVTGHQNSLNLSYHRFYKPLELCWFYIPSFVALKMMMVEQSLTRQFKVFLICSPGSSMVTMIRILTIKTVSDASVLYGSVWICYISTVIKHQCSEPEENK